MDATTIILALIGALPATIIALSNLIVTIRSHALITKVEVATNSMKDALVAATAKESYARGLFQGGEDEKKRKI
jgi:hypothetical protein